MPIGSRRVGGKSSAKFSTGPDREFDVISDEFVGQTKPGGIQLGKQFRRQAKATFEVASQTGRRPYFHFNGEPRAEVIQKLHEYGRRYDVEPVIDTKPF